MSRFSNAAVTPYVASASSGGEPGSAAASATSFTRPPPGRAPDTVTQAAGRAMPLAIVTVVMEGSKVMVEASFRWLFASASAARRLSHVGQALLHVSGAWSRAGGGRHGGGWWVGSVG
jgi:hypothetical protein